MMSNFFCFPPKASQNNGSHLKIFPPKPQKISASAARLLGCFFMSVKMDPPLIDTFPKRLLLKQFTFNRTKNLCRTKLAFKAIVLLSNKT